ncbi:translesion DNA synthesis-associated protein ImuA [Hydrogenophaga sp. T2]|uniref:translesion DNA synthesis-associated protein ImuA n=1 Tax=Hydrogenophaga sp. T2 TaxID=3132823 RepID=UPI003CE90350
MSLAVLKPSASEAPAWPAGVWSADRLDAAVRRTWSSGFAPLDAVLPGGGWPAHALTEILGEPDGGTEWRLLAPVLASLAREGRELLLVGPPHPPHLPGLVAWGLPARQLVWLQARAPAECLWSTEQLIKARTGGAVLAWLPQARGPQLRRLQVLAAEHDAPVFICRPAQAAHQASPAPLRLKTRAQPDWGIELELLKRKGPPLARPLRLQVVPPGLAAVLPPRLWPLPRPSTEPARVVVRPVSEPVLH